MYQRVYNISNDTNILMNLLLFGHHFLKFQQVFHMLLVCFLQVDQKMVYCQLMNQKCLFILMVCNT